jgi:hypothetical protein
MVQSIVHWEAMVLTFTDCLLLMACVFAFALILTPLVRKPRQRCRRIIGEIYSRFGIEIWRDALKSRH